MGRPKRQRFGRPSLLFAAVSDRPARSPAHPLVLRVARLPPMNADNLVRNALSECIQNGLCWTVSDYVGHVSEFAAKLTLPFSTIYKPSQITAAIEHAERGGKILLDFT
jgi:hypothetical protein